MAHHRFDTHVNAPPDLVFELWTDPERWRELIGGVTKVTDISGPLDRPADFGCLLAHDRASLRGPGDRAIGISSP